MGKKTHIAWRDSIPRMNGAYCGPASNGVAFYWRRTCETAPRIRRRIGLSGSVRREVAGPTVYGAGVGGLLPIGEPRCFQGDCRPCRHSSGGQSPPFGEDAQEFARRSGDAHKRTRAHRHQDGTVTSRACIHLMLKSAPLSKTDSPDRAVVASHKDGTESILVSSAFHSRDMVLFAYGQHNTRGVERQDVEEATDG